MTSNNIKNGFCSNLTMLIGSLIFLLALYAEYSYSFQSPISTRTINLSTGQYALNRNNRKYPLEVSTSILRMSDSSSDKGSISIPFDGSEDRFDRWKFLQDFLEGDHPSADVVNIILYRVLKGALKYPRPSGGSDTQGSDDTVEMTADVKNKIQAILADHSTNGRVNAVMTMSNDDDDFEEAERVALTTLEQLDGILPDPVEEEDDFKSLWDTVIELYGREAVKINEQQRPVLLDWKIASTVTRVLLHYDFLTYGIIDGPL